MNIYHISYCFPLIALVLCLVLSSTALPSLVIIDHFMWFHFPSSLSIVIILILKLLVVAVEFAIRIYK